MRNSDLIVQQRRGDATVDSVLQDSRVGSYDSGVQGHELVLLLLGEALLQQLADEADSVAVNHVHGELEGKC